MMRKEEYFHLHALFVELRQFLQETGDVPDDAFAAYEAYGVGPMAIHRRKDDHHQALRLLTEGVLATIAAQREPATDRAVAMPSVRTEVTPPHEGAD